MKSERSFNILTKITADWDEIDQMIKDILAADTENTIDEIAISRSSVIDGVLNPYFTFIVSVNNYTKNDLYEKVSSGLRIDFVRPDMVSADAVTLWEKNHDHT